MNHSALHARNYRLRGRRPPSARLGPEGGRRDPVNNALPSLHASILREQSHRYHNKLALVNKISHALAKADSNDDLYDRLAKSTFSLLPRIDLLYVGQREAQNRRIHCTYAALEDCAMPHVLDLAEEIYPSGPELLNEAARLGRPVVVDAIYPAPSREPWQEELPPIQSALAAPMIYQGEVIGALAVMSSIRRRFGAMETDLLSLLGNTAAVAFENLRLRTHLADTSRQLDQAYDATVEAWSRALELRDRATEDHGCRVAEMTVRLAISLGYHPADLTYLRFGAQLHDIGKIGVPDSVLLKPGPLDEQDKKIMRKHPVYAYEMLSSIPNFTPILEIPYSHHERWDGCGYPRGLSGEQIPLPARIFAVIDVWDALRSDRPYRSAWPEHEAITYIRDQSGKHFDPQVVDAFLGMMVEPAAGYGAERASASYSA